MRMCDFGIHKWERLSELKEGRYESCRTFLYQETTCSKCGKYQQRISKRLENQQLYKETK